MDLLDRAVKCLRAGADREGLTMCHDGIDRLKGLLVPDCGLDDEVISALWSAAEPLLVCTENGDLSGLADVLEFSFCPAIRKSGEGVDANDSGQ